MEFRLPGPVEVLDDDGVALPPRSLGELGACSAAEGDYSTAVPLYEASLARLAETDDDHGIGVMLANLAAAYEGLGETVKARDASLEALRIQLLGIAAQIALERGAIEEAGLLSGTFEEQFAALGIPQAEEAERLRRVREGVAALADLEALLDRGRGLTLDEALALLEGVIDVG